MPFSAGRTALALTAIAIASALTACDLTGSGKGSGREVVLGDLWRSNPYSVVESRIVVPETPSENRYCQGDELIIEPDTTGGWTMPISLDGNTLRLVMRDTIIEESGALVREDFLLERVGSGTGLEGTWVLVDERYVVISGTLTAEEKKWYADAETRRRANMIENHYYVVFKAGNLSWYEDEALAKRFLKSWAEAPEAGFPADSALYDMDVSEIDRYTVRQKGRKTGESVTLRLHSNGIREYASSDPSHLPVTMDHRNPTCPDSPTPAWYQAFQEANRKPLPDEVP